MSERSSVADRIHAQLLAEIVGGQLAPGTQHSIYSLAERLGASRTPVREAVLRLADARMVRIERNRGVRILGVDRRDIREIFEARILLEVPAARFAAEHATPELLAELDSLVARLRVAAKEGDVAEFTRHDRRLHEAILLATGNGRVAGIVAGLRDATQAMGASTIDTSRSIDEVRTEHVPIVDAIRHRDGAEAERLMLGHLVTTALLLLRQVADDAHDDARWLERWAAHQGLV